MTRNIPEKERQKLSTNVCVHPEREPERVKCSLEDSEGLSAQIENLSNLGPEELDQAWRLCSAPSDRAGSAATC